MFLEKGDCHDDYTVCVALNKYQLSVELFSNYYLVSSNQLVELLTELLTTDENLKVV